ncbi:MAG TPA: uracil-DNA glycosylase family protein, partial [Actinomycetota bacterium]|nr:uracil-DNA glycosylase family protein [Actinomycetota bacterium]
MDAKAPLAHFENCPLRDRPFVPGYGPPMTDRVIVGAAPGQREVVQGKPFVGASG